MTEIASRSARARGAPQLGPPLLELLSELARELQPSVDVESIDWDARLERDLGIDSLSRVELLLRLEQRFDVRLREEELAVAETPRDLLQLIAGSEAGERDRWSAVAVTDSSQAASVATQIPVPRSDAGLAIRPPFHARTLIEVLDHYCERHPDRRHLSLYDEGDRLVHLTYAQLRSRALEVGAGLRAQGFAPGAPVAIMLPTSLEYFYVFYGVLAAGLVPVPLYPPARPSQLEDHLRRQIRILDNCRAPLLVTVPEAKGAARLLRSQVATLERVLTVADLEAESAAAPRVVHRARGSDLAFLQYTSGSTGQPKGVALSHDNLLANLRAMLSAAEATPDDVFVSWLPLYHDMGLIGAGMGTLYGGFPLVLMSPLTFLGRPGRWLRAVSDHRATISGGPNFAYELCLSKIPDRDLEGVDLSSWRLAFNGAEPVLARTLERFAEKFARYGLRREALHPVYGLAEASLGIAFPPPGREARVDRIDRRSFFKSGRAVESSQPDALVFVGCGYPLPGHQIRIADDGGSELPDRTIGRVQFRGPSATRGYYRSPEQTRKILVGDWVDSGDLGYVADGELFLTGRRKDLIIKAGRNLSPSEIEEAVNGLEGVRRGCVAAFAVRPESHGTTSSERDDSGAGAEPGGTDWLVIVAETRLEQGAARADLRRRILAAVTDVAGAAADDVVLAPPGSVLKTSSGKIRRAACSELYREGKLGKSRPSVARQLSRLAISSVAPQARRALRSASHLAYSLYAYTILLLVVACLVPALVLVPGLRRRQTLTRWAARSLLRLGGIRCDARGRSESALEGVSAPRPTIVAINHQSYADALVIAATLLPGPKIMAKRELGGIAPLRWLWRRIGVEMVERFDRERSLEDARTMVAELARGASLVAFPEGTFTRLPGLLPFRMGVFVCAAEAGATVTPAVLRGTRSLLRAHQWRLQRGPVSLTLLPPISPRGQDWRAAVELRDRVRAEMLAHCGEPDLAEEREEGLEKLRAQREGASGQSKASSSPASGRGRHSRL